MYKVFFENRVINIFAHDEFNHTDEPVIFCKSKKSFDNAYHVFLNDLSIDRLNIKADYPEKIFKYLKKKYKHVRAAGGLVINSNNEYLVIKRNNKWDLPKGKIEKRESKKVAAMREVEEECGISGMEILNKLTKTYHTYTFREQTIFKTTYWYSMKYIGNEVLTPQEEEGITEVRWVKKDQISEMVANTYESLKDVFTYAQ